MIRGVRQQLALINMNEPLFGEGAAEELNDFIIWSSVSVVLEEIQNGNEKVIQVLKEELDKIK